MKNIKELKQKRNTNWILLATVIIIIVGWLLTPKIVFHLIETSKPIDIGQFGDLYGTINALFSGLAFALLIYTARMQSIELELQREELSKSTKAQKKIAKLNVSQLELQEQIRRNSIKPDFKININQLGDTTNFRHNVEILVLYNPLKITNLLSITSQNVKSWEIIDNNTINIPFDQHDKLNFYIAGRIDPKSRDSMVVSLSIHFEDQDSRKYKCDILVNFNGLISRSSNKEILIK